MIDRHGLCYADQHPDDPSDPDFYLYWSTAEPRPEALLAAGENLDRLNDLCVVCLDAVGDRLAKMVRRLAQLDQQPADLDTSDGVVAALDQASLESCGVPMWQGIGEVMAPAMCLLMLAAFVEGTLKALCVELRIPVRQRPGVATIEACLASLRGGNLAVVEPEEWTALRERLRGTRNAVAHGDDPEVIMGHVRGLPMRDAFRACSRLLYAVERAYLERGP